MKRSVRSLLAGVFTSPGRRLLRTTVSRLAWPVLGPLAGAYRRSALRRTKVVAIVGSYGKTTARLATCAALDARRPPRPGMNSSSAIARLLLRTRPSEMHTVLEVGIGAPGQMAAYASALRPDIVVVTCIGSEHSRAFGTLEATRDEKSQMVRALPPSGIAVLNGDDPNVVWMARHTRARTVTFGLGADCDVRATDVRLDWPRGTEFTLCLPGRMTRVRVPLIGRSMIRSVLAALAVGWAEGLEVGRMLPRMATLTPARDRMQPMATPTGAMVLNDSLKSGWETVVVALETLADIPTRRRIAIVGHVNEPLMPQGQIYKRLGEQLAAAASEAIFVGHSRAFRSVRTGARSAGMADGRLAFAGTLPMHALDMLPDDLGPGDVILVKGRPSQHMSRLALALAGWRVRCTKATCVPAAFDCRHCSSVEPAEIRSADPR